MSLNNARLRAALFPPRCRRGRDNPASTLNLEKYADASKVEYEAKLKGMKPL